MSVLVGVMAAVVTTSGCKEKETGAAIVLTQTPTQTVGRFMPRDLLDLRYPAGSRVILAVPPARPDKTTVLSGGFHSAGSPVLSADGLRVLFCGKLTATGDWQIYEVPARGGVPRPLTSLAGGAMDPAMLPDGRFAFSSPVPSIMMLESPDQRPELFAQSFAGGPPHQLTHSRSGATDATVLRDGRILFVSGGRALGAVTNQGLFTINNDGTEVSAYACQHDGHAALRRPREIPSGRVFFLAGAVGSPKAEGRAEQVWASHPFSSRAPFLPDLLERCRSVDAGFGGDVLVSVRTAEVRPGMPGQGSLAIFRLGLEAKALGAPFFDDPVWNDLEACVVMARPKPMGRLSNVNTNDSTGELLCLDVNHTGILPKRHAAGNGASKVRFLRLGAGGHPEVLGEVPVADDGSILAEVPADVTLGFETLDHGGQVLGRCPPGVWLRPGENRTCVGCHEPHNYSPENFRPLAVKRPPVRLPESGAMLARRSLQP